ncbi:MAG: MBL fold metallo-hydrolase [Verrucomicrobia bacterium]|nr:MBL fold metallo-hydrolase [Verrucomicrobiota bacterium]
MKLTVGGARGSTPVAAPGFHKFGGDTTSFLVTNDRAGLIVDMGSGMRNLEPHLTDDAAGGETLVLLTHYHLDHVIGLPVFSRIYSETAQIRFAGVSHAGIGVELALSGLLSQPFWPLQLDALSARVSFLALDNVSSEPMEHAGFRIRWRLQCHPGGSTVFRIDDIATEKSIVIATDAEWGLSSKTEKACFMDLCAEPSPPNVLIFDGQYDPEEYDSHKGWGHSTWQEAIDAARLVGAEQLLITHHDPDHDDEHLACTEIAVKEQMPSAGLARAGMEIQI